MRSKNKKQKPAYRRGERLAIFLKRCMVSLLIIILGAAIVLGIKMFSQKFSLKEIIISGNYHLDRDEVLSIVNMEKGKPLLKLDFGDIDKRLRENSWIKKAALRKQFPDTLVIKIDEAAPRALLREKEQLYLIDEDGRILESIKDETVPFLPVIKDIDRWNRKGISEALKLVKVLTEKSGLADRGSIEIGLESYGLSVEIEGELIKVGYGRYSEKFDRWMELEPEIRKRGVPIMYIDLRFKDSVIVKPLKEEEVKTSS